MGAEEPALAAALQVRVLKEERAETELKRAQQALEAARQERRARAEVLDTFRSQEPALGNGVDGADADSRPRVAAGSALRRAQAHLAHLRRQERSLVIELEQAWGQEAERIKTLNLVRARLVQRMGERKAMEIHGDKTKRERSKRRELKTELEAEDTFNARAAARKRLKR